MRCLQAGAHAFVTKSDPVGTLLRAIRATAAGHIVVPPNLAGSLRFGSAAPHPSKNDLGARLTNRELEVFRLSGLAVPTRTIAEKMGISVKTVESHREHIKNKLDLATHSELVARAAQWLRESGHH
jgi:DNA-binding NarL/FixJ family response regulator